MNSQDQRILYSLMIVSLINSALPIKAMDLDLVESRSKKAKTDSIHAPAHGAVATAESAELIVAEENPLKLAITGNLAVLHSAARNGQREVVELLLNKGAERDALDENGWTALHWAANNGHKEVVEVLLHRGAPIDEPSNGDSSTALHLAASNGHTELVELLLNRRAKTEIRDCRRESALHIAAKNGHREVVKLLLDRGAKRDVVSNNSNTALDWAAYYGHRQVVELLLNRGAKNAGRRVGNTLSLAAASWHTEVVELLINRGAQVDSINEDNNCTALHYAVDFKEKNLQGPINGCLEVVELLLNRGARIEHPDKNGKTVLFKAAMNGKREVTELLLNRAARIDACDEHGLTALHSAAINGYREVVELLLARGAQINARTSHRIHGFDKYCNTMLYPFQHKTIEKGMTALHFAAMRHQRDVVDLLISKGADLNALNEKEETPLYLAVAFNDDYVVFGERSEHKGVVKLLVSRNAQVDAQTSYGLTPLARASMYENLGHFKSNDLGSQRREIVQLLLNANAAITTTALHAPARYGHTEVVELLLDRGALIDALDEDGNTALHFAIDNDQREVVQLLIKKGADTDLLNKQDLQRYQSLLKTPIKAVGSLNAFEERIAELRGNKG